MTMPTEDEVIRLLGLQPHPNCGFVRTTFASADRLPAAAVPRRFGEAPARDRSLGSTLYFLVSADAHLVMHAIRSDQVYHHYLGVPLEVLLLYPDGRGEIATCGADLLAGERPQLVIPADTVHLARVKGGAGYALMGTCEWIEVDPADVSRPAVEALSARYPGMAAEIAAFAGGTRALERPLAGAAG